MAELAIPGVVLGSVSLTIQVVDECIRCYKYFSEASNMPDSHRFLQIRLQMERGRFLTFAEEAGLLSTESDPSETLSIDAALFQQALSEMKMLFERFQQSNGRYVDLIPPKEHTDPSNLQSAMMDLVCTTHATIAQIDLTVAPHSSGTSKLGWIIDKAVTKGKKLRTVITEPKRLIWVSFDENKFKSFLAKLGGLNDFFISALDRLSSRRKDKAIEASYLEILDTKTNQHELHATIKALTCELQQQNALRSAATPISNFFPQATALEMQCNIQRMKNMKQLADIKLCRLGIESSTDFTDAFTENDEIFAGLNVTKLFTSDKLPSQRQIVPLNDEFVWLEPIDASSDTLNETANSMPHTAQRVYLLTRLLTIALPEDFRTPPCYGYTNLQIDDQSTQQNTFSLVLKLPKEIKHQETNIFNLRGLLLSQPTPSLSIRISLCCKLAECVYNFHAVNWLHKGLRSENILFFGPDSARINLKQPYLTGLNFSRPSERPEMTEKPKFNPETDIYRHPLNQAGQSAGVYRKSYDLYSLGIILMEIACWSPIETILGFQNLSEITGLQLSSIKDRLVTDNDESPSAKDQECCQYTGSEYLQQVAVHCGNTFRDVVELLLCAREMEKPIRPREDDLSRSRRLRDVYVREVLEPLQKINESL